MTTRFFIGIVFDDDGYAVDRCKCRLPHRSWQSAEACARAKSSWYERVGHREVRSLETKGVGDGDG